MLSRNCTFDTYRRAAGGTGRSYSGTKTITGGMGYVEALSGELRSVLGIDNSVQGFQLMTEASDFQIRDKVDVTQKTRSGDVTGTYYVHGIEPFYQNALTLCLVTLLKTESI